MARVRRAGKVAPMLNPQSARLLSDERGTLEAEAALARDEQRLWQKLEATFIDPFDQRSKALLARVDRLATSPDVHPDDIAQARQIIAEASAPGPVPAENERAAALVLRQNALKAREAAAKALAEAITALESLRSDRARDLDEVEQFLGAAEQAVADSEANRRRESEEAARKAAEAEAARVAAEEAARAEAARVAAALAEQASSAQPVPSVAEVPPSPVEAPAAAEGPSLRSSGLDITLIQAPAPKVDETPAGPRASVPAKKKVSRRRRARVAPPPAKIAIEVATYGDNNFYAGFDNDVSRGGVFVASLETLPPGHELTVEISLEGRTIQSRARVDFNRDDNLANADCTPGAGLKLLDLSPADAEVIQRFFEKRQPMFHVSA